MTTFKWHATTPLTVKGAREFWDVRYQHNVTPWDRGQITPALVNWLDQQLLQPCRILVPGCGRGYEVIELIRRGFDVVAVDISPRAVNSVRRSLDKAGLSAKLIEADLFKWTPDGAFDAVYEQNCLCALLPEQRPGYASLLADWVQPRGKLFALFMQTDKAGGPPFHCGIEAMQRLFTCDSWFWPSTAPVKTPHPSGFHELGVILARK